MYFLLQHAYCHLITWLVLIPHTPTISRFFNVPFTCLYKVPVQSSIIYPETLSFIHSFRFYVNVNIIEYKFKDSTMLAMGGVRGSQGNLSMRRSMWRSMWGSMWRAMWHTWITDNNVLHVILNENWYLVLCSNTLSSLSIALRKILTLYCLTPFQYTHEILVITAHTQWRTD